MEIYLIEDDEIYSEFISKSLKQKNLKVKPFYSAEECIPHLNGNKPDVIIIDYKLPGMNGIEFYEKIKEDFNEDDKKIIILSSIDDGNLVLDFIQKGIRDYVIKDEHVIDSLISIIEGNDEDYFFFGE